MEFLSNFPKAIAVLIPFYGRPESLAETLQSLSREAIPHDVFVVDDGNPTKLSVDPEWHTHVTVLRHDKNRGITAALNTGLKYILQLGYSYIARLDAGDLDLPHRLSTQLQFMESNPECMLCGSAATWRNKTGKILYNTHPPSTPEQIRRRLHLQCCLLHTTAFFRSKVFDYIEPYQKRYPAAEDYDLIFRIAERFPVVNLPESLVLVLEEFSMQSISTRMRRRQILSGMRIQVEHFDIRRAESYGGILSSVVRIFLPRSWMALIKTKICDIRTHLNKDEESA